MEALLETKNLSKNFGGLYAINPLNTQFSEGQITGIIGPNGAGKTTLFNLITGWVTPSGGQVFFKGEDITRLPPYNIVQRGISRTFQVTNIFPGLTTFANIRVPVLARGGKSLSMVNSVDKASEINEETMEILELVGLVEDRDKIASSLPHGYQRCLQVGIGLASNPELLLLDEPTAGMSPEESANIINLIKELSDKKGVTIVFTEHDLDMVFSAAEKIIVLDKGSIIAEGTGIEIKKNKAVKVAYLGEEE